MIAIDTTPDGRFETAELSVCADCIMILANGEGSAETVDAMTAKWGEDGRWLVPGGDNLGYFSSECDGCGGTDYGDRFTATLLKPIR